MAILLKADGSIVEVPGQLTLARMQELVGGWIEMVTIGGTPDRREVLIVDEEGRLKSKPMNGVATSLYRGQPARHDGVIVGDAVRCVVTNVGLDSEAYL